MDEQNIRIVMDHNLWPLSAHLAVWRLGDGAWSIRVTARPGLTLEQYVAVRDWVAMRVQRLVAPDGSEPDKWQIMPDGAMVAGYAAPGSPLSDDLPPVDEVVTNA